MSHEGSHVLFEPVAVIEARGALVLAQVLASCLRDGLSLKALLMKSGLSPAEVEAGLTAAVALRGAGYSRLERIVAARGTAETPFPRDRAPSVAMTTKDASRVLGLCERQIRNLAAAGDIPSSKIGVAYAFDRADVLAFRDARWSA